MSESNEVKMNELASAMGAKPGENTDKQVTANRVMEWIKTTQGIITGIVAVLVILPSLFNALIDV